VLDVLGQSRVDQKVMKRFPGERTAPSKVAFLKLSKLQKLGSKRIFRQLVRETIYLTRRIVKLQKRKKKFGRGLQQFGEN
jgi:hypothetical protein